MPRRSRHSPPLPHTREITLGSKPGEADARQVGQALEDDVALLPPREELAVEGKQVVELKRAFQLVEDLALNTLRRGEFAVRRQHRRERGEIQRHVLEAMLLRPAD